MKRACSVGGGPRSPGRLTLQDTAEHDGPVRCAHRRTRRAKCSQVKASAPCLGRACGHPPTDEDHSPRNQQRSQIGQILSSSSPQPQCDASVRLARTCVSGGVFCGWQKRSKASTRVALITLPLVKGEEAVKGVVVSRAVRVQNDKGTKEDDRRTAWAGRPRGSTRLAASSFHHSLNSFRLPPLLSLCFLALPLLAFPWLLGLPLLCFPGSPCLTSCPPCLTSPTCLRLPLRLATWTPCA